MPEVFLVWSDNNESYDLMGVFPDLESAVRAAEPMVEARKNYNGVFEGNTVSIEKWLAPGRGPECEVWSRTRYMELNKIVEEERTKTDESHKLRVAQLRVAQLEKERDAALQARVDARLKSLGLNPTD